MTSLACPVCSSVLSPSTDNRGYRCSNGHNFDRARQGYVNLLLNQHKHSRQPGDSQDMVVARRDFLNAGFYQSVVNTFTEVIKRVSLPYHDRRNLNYTDVACGEGYYTGAGTEALSTLRLGQGVNSIGIDISTPAIKSACRRTKEITWAVGNANALPLLNASQDMVSCLFCRPNYREAARVLCHEGVFIVAHTGSQHLIELRKRLYRSLKADKTTSRETPAPEGFKPISIQGLKHQITIKPARMIANLVKMTPHVWRSTPEAQSDLQSLDELEVTIDIDFFVYQKNGIDKA